MIDKKTLTALASTFCLTAVLFTYVSPFYYKQPLYVDLLRDIDRLNAQVDELQTQVDGLNDLSVEQQSRIVSLQSKVDYLNASLIESQTRISSLNNTVLDLQSQIDTLNNTLTSRINNLDATVASLLNRVSELEANYSVTNLKLAPNAIPFNSTSISAVAQTTETMNWIDMSDTNVNITLERTSNLLIVFSSEAKDDTGDWDIMVRALIGGTTALPSSVYLTPIVGETGFTGLMSHRHTLDYSAYTYNFYKPSVSAGTYNVKIQWRVTGGTGSARYRTLTVIALPA